MDSSIFAGKTLLITGGTGSFGNTVLRHFLSTEIGEIRIFSRRTLRRCSTTTRF
jgi:UDP-glucose 4-epimerase